MCHKDRLGYDRIVRINEWGNEWIQERKKERKKKEMMINSWIKKIVLTIIKITIIDRLDVYCLTIE